VSDEFDLDGEVAFVFCEPTPSRTWEALDVLIDTLDP
jgi:hypothetical protein